MLPIRSTSLQYVVREPYGADKNTHRKGLVKAGETLRIASKMREAKLFLDGHATVFGVELGDVIEMRRSADSISVLGLARGARREQ